MKLSDLQRLVELVNERNDAAALATNLGRMGPAEKKKLAVLLFDDNTLLRLGQLNFAHEDDLCRALLQHSLKASKDIETEIRSLGVEVDDDPFTDGNDLLDMEVSDAAAE
jgi:hypothetical protein